VQAAMALLPLPPALAMLAFGLAGSAGPLNFVLAAQQFEPSLSGRATTALNLFVFAGVVLAQAFVGAVLDAVGPLADGRFPPQGYALAMILLIVAQLGAVFWLLAGWGAPSVPKEGSP